MAELTHHGGHRGVTGSCHQLHYRGGASLLFDNLMTVADHKQHLWTVDYLRRKAPPAVVIAATGMCTVGRVVNYLKALAGDERTDIVFCGYQAQGTPGPALQGGPGGCRWKVRRCQCGRGYTSCRGTRRTQTGRICCVLSAASGVDRSGWCW